MTTEARHELERITETLGSLCETADGIAVDAGTSDPPESLSARADVLSKALNGLRADVQALQEELEG